MSEATLTPSLKAAGTNAAAAESMAIEEVELEGLASLVPEEQALRAPMLRAAMAAMAVNFSLDNFAPCECLPRKTSLQAYIHFGKNSFRNQKFIKRSR
jgi:hypothetical protein